MSAMLLIFFTVLGLIIGSFLNVAILRHNTGKSLAGRSGCMSCGAPLRWYELLPVVSFIALMGKCKSCGSRISIQYPIVELSLAVLFMLVALQHYNLFNTTLALIISSLLLVIAVYDARHTIIPNLYVYTFAVLSIFWHLPNLIILEPFSIGIYLSQVLLSGVVLATPFALLWFISGGRWIGLGDAKLMLGIGFILGLWSGFIALTIASVVGAVLGLVYIAWRRLCIAHLGGRELNSKIRLEIPYGPFLIFGFFCVWFLHLDIWYMQLIGL